MNGLRFDVVDINAYCKSMRGVQGCVTSNLAWYAGARN